MELENITLGQLAQWLAFVVAFVGGVLYLKKQIGGQLEGTIKKALDEMLQPIVRKLDEVTLQLGIVDQESCKDYLVSFLSDVEKGNPVDEIERERFYERYQHYTQHGGNSYIKQKVEYLQSEGKL